MLGEVHVGGVVEGLVILEGPRNCRWKLDSGHLNFRLGTATIDLEDGDLYQRSVRRGSERFIHSSSDSFIRDATLNVHHRTQIV